MVLAILVIVVIIASHDVALSRRDVLAGNSLGTI